MVVGSRKYFVTDFDLDFEVTNTSRHLWHCIQDFDSTKHRMPTTSSDIILKTHVSKVPPRKCA